MTRAGFDVTMITAYGVSAAEVPEPAGRLHAVRPVAIEKPRRVARSALRRHLYGWTVVPVPVVSRYRRSAARLVRGASMRRSAVSFSV